MEILYWLRQRWLEIFPSALGTLGDFLTWTEKNKEWLFSGVAVPICGAIIGAFATLLVKGFFFPFKKKKLESFQRIGFRYSSLVLETLAEGYGSKPIFTGLVDQIYRAECIEKYESWLRRVLFVCWVYSFIALSIVAIQADESLLFSLPIVQHNLSKNALVSNVLRSDLTANGVFLTEDIRLSSYYGGNYLLVDGSQNTAYVLKSSKNSLEVYQCEFNKKWLNILTFGFYANHEKILAVLFPVLIYFGLFTGVIWAFLSGLDSNRLSSLKEELFKYIDEIEREGKRSTPTERPSL